MQLNWDAGAKDIRDGSVGKQRFLIFAKVRFELYQAWSGEQLESCIAETEPRD